MQRAATLSCCTPLLPHARPRCATVATLRRVPDCVPRAAARPPSRRRAAAPGASEPVSAEDLTPAGCERIRLSLKKPLGLVLEQNSATGDIFVVELLDGSAARDGRVAVGDQLIATSAIVFEREEDYGGVSVKKGMTMVRLLCKGETFDTVMRAIGTHPGTQPVRSLGQRSEGGGFLTPTLTLTRRPRR